MKIRTAMAVALVASASLSGCVTEDGARQHAGQGADGPWEASLYSAGGGATEMFGPFETRGECADAAMERLGADDRNDRPMAFNCTLMRR
ncbi:MAG: hypothetical protein OXU50_01250 [Gammaproteobacteria bacterium]|nr:hypothetical protein [Gammaproteobacteria bacterium]MDD9807231.1 hypothetical protein [Gammaproteobacteria bacterium]MDD9868519.1 hypothetical protein [Gammaproteobacteria bacterium]MDD9886665.1 hypothetical protein [Gammaproteobacteria bacterium]